MKFKTFPLTGAKEIRTNIYPWTHQLLTIFRKKLANFAITKQLFMLLLFWMPHPDFWNYKLLSLASNCVINEFPVLVSGTDREFLLIIQFNSSAVDNFQTEVRDFCSQQILQSNPRLKQGFLICQSGKIFASGNTLFNLWPNLFKH